MLVRELAGLVFVVVGASLVLLRPNPMTWGFFLFCCGVDPAPSAVSATTTAYNVSGGLLIVGNVTYLAGMIGLDMFALRFPTGEARGWRIIAERICIVLLVPLAAFALWATLGAVYANLNLNIFWVDPFVTAAAVLLAVVALVSTYRLASDADRSRLRWLVFGSTIALAALCANAFAGDGAPPLLAASLEAIFVCMPLAVAYAVIRHRVIDINFVISRALVYAILTSIVVAVFALIDWLIAKELDQTKIALAAEILAALALGFWMNGLHGRLNDFIESTLFRQRHAAARRLSRAAASLQHAETVDAIDEMLVAEPVDAMKLASAAVFRAREGTGFAREAAVDWPEDSARSLDASEQLVMLLRGERGPLRLDDIRWPRADLPSGDKEPALAVPVFVRDRLIAIALYGSHRNGEALDPDEVTSLEGLAGGAATAYDHLEAEALRHENAMLRSRLAAGI